MQDRPYAKEFFQHPDEGACPVCNLTYVEDYPPDQLTHQHCHRTVLNTFEPRPNARMAKLHIEHGDFISVFVISPLFLRRRLFRVSRAFVREFGASAQYDESGDLAHGFLVVDVEGRTIGGFAIRWREYSDAPPGWGLAFIWIAPDHRRKGYLRRAWEFARSNFDGIEPEPPYSRASAAFFKDRDDVRPEVRDYARRFLEQAPRRS